METDKKPDEKCYLCEGTGKIKKYRIVGSSVQCPLCKGTGKDVRQLDTRPLVCDCLNTGKCNRCKGERKQKKHLLSGELISCNKCKGSGICQICLDAPNGGYYMTWYIHEQTTGAFQGEEKRRLKKTSSRIKELSELRKKLLENDEAIKKFEVFANYPSLLEIREFEKKRPYFIVLCDIVDKELERYEKYLGQFQEDIE